MLKKISFAAVIFLFFSVTAIMPHGDAKHKEKVEKVSTQMQMGNMNSQMNMGGGQVGSDSLKQLEENKTQEKDFAKIREDVEKSAVPTVIKAVSLAAFIAGLAFLYLPRKKKENSNV